MGVTNNMKLPITERYKSIAGDYWPVVIDPSQPSAGHAVGSVVQAIFSLLCKSSLKSQGDHFAW